MKAQPSRRHFLKSSAALMAGALAWSARLAQAQDNLREQINVDLQGEAFWQQVRDQFAFDEAIVPMNAANLCPAFRQVTEAVARFTADIDRDCSFNNRAQFSALLDQTRADVARQLNVSADEIALVRNTSEANNTISNGLELGPGDEVVIWDENHPTNHVAWQVRAARSGFTVRTVATPQPLTSADDLVQAFSDALTPRTRVLALTHVSNVTGIKLPIAQLTALAHERDVYVHVDGAQTWGAMALDLRALGVDSFTASAHKWYMGPREVGLLYVKESRIADIWPLVVASGWGSGAETRQLGARKFESLGQRDDAALAGLGVTARLHDVIGPERIEQRTTALAQLLKTRAAEVGMTLVTPMSAELSFGVCILATAAGQEGRLSNALYEQAGIAGAGTGGLRLCPAIYNTVEHVERAVQGARRLVS